jgi:hypothetical protein
VYICVAAYGNINIAETLEGGGGDESQMNKHRKTPTKKIFWCKILKSVPKKNFSFSFTTASVTRACGMFHRSCGSGCKSHFRPESDKNSLERATGMINDFSSISEVLSAFCWITPAFYPSAFYPQTKPISCISNHSIRHY